MALLAVEQANEIATAVEAPPAALGYPQHKNSLQEYAQRSGVSLPIYSTANEGKPHRPMFRATVVVDGIKITSPNTFFRRKDAEQDVAKLALEHVLVKFKNESSINIHKDSIFCKLILNEYASKFKMDKPTYTTIQQGLGPIFVTTATFDGKTYVGFAGRNKKQAEQNAACIIIDSILANANTGTAMSQIIKTKGKLYAVMYSHTNIENTISSNINSNAANVAIEGKELVPDPAYVAVGDSQTFITKKRKPKKRKSGQSKKKLRADEQSIRD